MKVECPTCGQNVNGRWEKLSPGYVNALKKLEFAIDRNGTGYAHLQRDCGLTKSEYTNFYRIRYWGFAQRAQKGYWQINQKGRDFLAGRVSAPRKLFVFNNEVQKIDPSHIFVQKVMKGTPYWMKKDDYVAAMSPAELKGGLFDGE